MAIFVAVGVWGELGCVALQSSVVWGWRASHKAQHNLAGRLVEVEESRASDGESSNRMTPAVSAFEDTT